MLLVKTRLGQSAIHGIGLFADQFIPKGTITWKYHSKFDSALKKEELKKMSRPARDQYMKYAYWDKQLKKFVLCFDDQRFINHSFTHSNIFSTPRQDVAVRDIKKGEELFCDYSGFDTNYFARHKLDPKHLLEPTHKISSKIKKHKK